MPKKVGPITPDEVGTKKAEVFPSEVFESFNEMITKKFSVGQATFTKDDLLKLMIHKGLSVNQIMDEGWLNVESSYEEAGWEVHFEKPGFNESGPSVFTFKKKK